MSGEASNQGFEDVCRRVEEFALDLVLGKGAVAERTSGWRSALEELSAAATAAGLRQTAAGADELRTLLAEADGLEESELEVRVQAGLAGLQRALKLQQPPTKEVADPRPEVVAPEDEAPSLADDPESLNDFVVETREHFEAIDRQLLAVEVSDDPAESIHDLFRRFHTIKGLAGFLDFHAVRDLAHAVENLLGAARDAGHGLDGDSADLLFAAVDQLRADSDAVEAAARTGEAARFGDRSALIARLSSSRSATEPPESETKGESSGPGATMETSAPRVSAMRVDPAKLEQLAELAGELIVAQSQVAHDPESQARPDSPLATKLSRFARLSQEIQASAMRLRMVPIEQLFDRTARLVRDLGRRCGKPVRLEALGGETEVDRAAVELLADPMVHLIRNSLDHGIETPEERAALGKPPEALLTLRASPRAGHILIELEDDGRGLDRTAIRGKAEQAGVVSPTQELAPSEIDDLIFHPGFTTTSAVTELSGRGVGLDVVRRHVQSLRGWIDVSSEDGRGVRFRLYVPLTLALIEGLIVSVAGERYVAPLSGVREIIRPTADMLMTLEGRSETASVRDELYSILRPAQFFGLRAEAKDLTEMFLVLIEFGGKRFGLAVDSFVGRQDVIIKALPSAGGERTPGVSGGTILGDGRVALILDLESLAGAA